MLCALESVLWTRRHLPDHQNNMHPADETAETNAHMPCWLPSHLVVSFSFPFPCLQLYSSLRFRSGHDSSKRDVSMRNDIQQTPCSHAVMSCGKDGEVSLAASEVRRFFGVSAPELGVPGTVEGLYANSPSVALIRPFNGDEFTGKENGAMPSLIAHLSACGR